MHHSLLAKQHTSSSKQQATGNRQQTKGKRQKATLIQTSYFPADLAHNDLQTYDLCIPSLSPLIPTSPSKLHPAVRYGAN
eukprot:jgi/Psemu1/11772/gm1.11772_g